MSENNQIMSVGGQLVGMPLAGPESFSQQQLEYLKSALGMDETVLFTSDSAVSSATLSESPYNFERLKLVIGENTTGYGVAEMTFNIASSTTDIVTAFFTGKSNANVMLLRFELTSSDISSVSIASYTTNFTSGTTVSVGHSSGLLTCIYKVIGIHRISGGNQ